MEQFSTEIFIEDLSHTVYEQLLENIIDRLKSDKTEMENLEIIVETEMEDDEIPIREKEEYKNWDIQKRLEEKAKEILENTFYGEITIG